MKKNYPLLILFFLCCSVSFAQSDDEKSIDLPVGKPVAASQTGISETTNPAPVVEKNALPKNQKVSPAVFYVENDKPVDQMTYQRHVQQSSSK